MIEKAVEKLSKQVDEAEVFKLEQKSLTIKTMKEDIESSKESHLIGYGIRALMDKRMGFYFTNTLDDSALEMAKKAARVAQRDEHLSLPDRQNYKKTPQTVFEVSVEKGLEMAHSMVSSHRDFPGVQPTTGTVSWGNSTVSIANSRGVFGVKLESTLTLYLGTVAKGREPSTGFYFQVSREPDLDAFEVGSVACRLARDSLNAGRLKTGKRRVILKPIAVTELLEYSLIPSFSAENVQRGRSKLKGQLGEKLFGGVSIFDDAILKGGLMSEPFDDEGVRAQRTALVKKGAVKGFLYDSYAADREGRESTGSAGRPTHAALPTIGPSNFMVQGNEGIENEGEALVVHGLVGAHTSNPISGDFSCETRNAFLDGKPVKKAIVSGNIFELLASNLGFGRDVEQYSSVISPSIEIPKIMVVG